MECVRLTGISDMKTNKHHIGIGIITHNRREVFLDTLLHMKQVLPEGAKLVIVDDASTEPLAEATYRFDQNVGIATAKNKCFELLDDCDHIFLFDDDCYPKVKGWELPYIESPEPHLMYIFEDLISGQLKDTKKLYDDGDLLAYDHARGCMLYFDRKCLDVAGGMDTEYRKWGYEHADLSNRIFNLGLTKFRFMDVPGSSDLFLSGDEQTTVRTTVPYKERAEYLQEMKSKYRDSFDSMAFIPYKPGAKQKFPLMKKSRNVVITSYFNSMPDNQRDGKYWEADYSQMKALIDSCKKQGVHLVILHNCFKEKDTEDVTHVFINQALNPYFQRWLSVWEYLRENPDIDQVFAVDATDVEVLKNPFDQRIIEHGKLYCGDEPQIVGCYWITQLVTKSQDMLDLLMEDREEVLMNCGVVGGKREMLMSLCRDMYASIMETYQEETIDMPIFNFLIYQKYRDQVVHGRGVTSVFKAYEEESPAWFKHK